MKMSKTVSLMQCPKCELVSDLAMCPVCNKKMKPYERAKNLIQRFPRGDASKIENRRVIKIIEEKCRDFGCPGNVESCKTGPMVTEYKFAPHRFTRVKQLKTLHEDLAVAIPAESVTVQRAPGEMAMAITVPNKERKEVSFDETLKNVVAHRYDMELPLNLGVTATGKGSVHDLQKMPHLLICGSTGTGKSVLINGILTSLLYTRSPKELELYLIDPKQVELLPYSGLPHVKRPPVSDVYDALGLMHTLIEEMKKRMAHIYFSRAKNLKELNAQNKAEGKPALPYIVLVIDEMAELIMAEKKSFTDHMTSISSLARAAGIYVIAATQRPSVDILSGKIKVNFPARVGLRVPSGGDSKTVFGRNGAEQLLGKGDMYFMNPDMPGLQRLHAAHCRQEDINKMLQLSTDIGHVHHVPADGLLPPQGKPVEVKPVVVEQSTTTEAPSRSLNMFLNEKGLTFEQARKLDATQQKLLNTQFHEWQARQRRQRNLR